MKTRIEYEKLEYDFWNLEGIREHFENGELYHKCFDRFTKLGKQSDLSILANGKDSIYRAIETPITLEDDLLEIAQANHGRNLEFIFNNGKLKIYDYDDIRAGLDPEIIHALSEALKRHGK